MKNHSLMQATLKCTWQFGVVEMGLNFRICGTTSIRSQHVEGCLLLPRLPGVHVQLQAESESISCGMCFACDILPPATTAITTGM